MKTKRKDYREKGENKSVYDRLYNTNTKKISKFVEDQELKRKEKEIIQTSFKPKTNTSKFGSRRRSLNDFINDIKKFNRNKESKIRNEAMKKALAEDKIVNSYFTAKKNRSKSPNLKTINSLYDRGVRKQMQRSISPESRPIDRSKIPKINKRSHLMIRDQNVSELLYNEAEKRSNKLIERRKSNFNQSNKSHTGSNEINNTNYLVNKISREIQSICHEQGFGQKDYHLEFSQVVIILIQMGYVTQSLTDNEKILINKLWEILKGEELSGILSRNLLFFLIGINQLKINQIYLKNKKLTGKHTGISLNNTILTNSDIDLSAIQIAHKESKNGKLVWFKSN